MYVFREIKNADDLLVAFQMRYGVYNEDPFLSHLVKGNTLQLSFDGYDIYAHHYGIYLNDERMIGYIRIIREDIYLAASELVKDIGEAPERPLPFNFNTHFPNMNKTEIIRTRARGNVFEICEPGRFVILPGFRSPGLAQFVIKCAMTVICESHVFPIGVIDCRRHHLPVYLRNGFEQVAIEENPDFMDNPWYLLAISCEGVTKKLPDLEGRINRFRTEGQITFQPKNTDQ